MVGRRPDHLLQQSHPRAARNIFQRHALIRELRGGVSHELGQDSWPEPRADCKPTVRCIEIKECAACTDNVAGCYESPGSMRSGKDHMGVEVRDDAPHVFWHRLLNPAVLNNMAQRTRSRNQSKIALLPSFVEPDHTAKGINWDANTRIQIPTVRHPRYYTVREDLLTLCGVNGQQRALYADLASRLPNPCVVNQRGDARMASSAVSQLRRHNL